MKLAKVQLKLLRFKLPRDRKKVRTLKNALIPRVIRVTNLRSDVGTHEYSARNLEASCNDVRDQVNAAAFRYVEALPTSNGIQQVIYHGFVTDRYEYFVCR